MTDNGLIHRGYIPMMEELDEVAMMDGVLGLFEKPFVTDDGRLKYIVRVRKMRTMGPELVAYEYVIFWRLISEENKLFSMSFCSEWQVQEVEEFAERFLQQMPDVTCPEELVSDE